jgi:hypothetical protein
MLSIDRYELQVDIQPQLSGIPDAPGRIAVSGVITLRNRTRQPVFRTTWLLYRLLTLDSLGDPHGVRPIRWRQNIRGLRDLPALHVNVVTLTFEPPLGEGESCLLALSYSGTVVGYREVFPYAHDAVERDRMVLRREILWHPIAGPPTVAGLFRGLLAPAEFMVRATVPEGWWAAMPSIPSTFDPVSHTCRVAGESAGLSLVGGLFEHFHLPSGDEAVIVHAPPSHRDWASRVASAIQVTTERLTAWVGQSPRREPWNVIEVPQHWGSEATSFALLIEHREDESAVFQEAVHETTHRWALPAGDRFCDESLAHYLEMLVLTAEWGAPYREQALRVWRTQLTEAPDAAATPIQTGALRMQDHVDLVTRVKGPLALAVLHSALGDEEFFSLLHRWFVSPRLAFRTASDFAAYVVTGASARIDASAFVADWFEQPKDLSALLPDRSRARDAVEEAARRYQR